jgi:hypothetical protein
MIWPALLVTLGVFGSGLSASAADFSTTVPYPVRSADWEETNGLFSSPPQQVMVPDGTGRSEFYLSPVEAPAQVFVTVVFEDAGEMPISVTWKSEETGLQIPMSENVSEGVPGWNQRTLRLPSALALQGGIVVVSGNQRSIARVRIDWLEPTETYVAVDQAIPGLVMGGRGIDDSTLTGRPEMSPPDAWFGEVFETALQDEPVSLDGGILFEIPFAESHATVLLKAKFQGVAPGDSVEVWINDQFAGTIQPATPPLTDPGYVRLTDQRVVYAGWREGSMFVPTGMLQAGENTLVMRPATPGCTVRDAALQILVPFDASGPDSIDLAWPEL